MNHDAMYNAIKIALDNAIAQTVRRIFYNVPANDRSPILAKIAYQNMRDTLRNRQAPDYNDPLTVVAYLLEYHASHVNMAYAIMHELNNLLPGGFPPNLHFVDFGAGTLAMLHGAWLYQAEMVSAGRLPPNIEFMCVDESARMLEAGQILVEQFANITQNTPELRNFPPPPDYDVFDWTGVAEAAGMNFMWTPEERAREQTPTILTSLHTVYGATVQALGRSMEVLDELFQPIATVTTFQTGNRPHAEEIWPYGPQSGGQQDEYEYEFGEDFRIPGYIQNATAKTLARRLNIIPDGEGRTRTHHLTLDATHSITQFFYIR